MDWQMVAVIVSVLVPVLLATGGLIYRLGKIDGRLKAMEERSDRQELSLQKLEVYARNISHDKMKNVIEAMHELELMILKITPKELWPTPKPKNLPSTPGV